MKRIPFLSIMFVVTILIGCQTEKKEINQTPQSLYRQQSMPSRYSDTSINGQESIRGLGQNEIGYFHYNPKNEAIKGVGGPKVIIDRNLLAEHIAHLVTFLPQVEQATALVTDDHIFLGLKTKDNRLNPRLKREAIRTAESVTPRYYKVHVSSNQKLETEINEIGLRMRGNSGVEGIKGDLEALLRKMGDSTPPDVNESIHPSGRDDVIPEER